MTRALVRILFVSLAVAGIAAIAFAVAPAPAFAQSGDRDCVDYSSGIAAQNASKGGDPNNLDADGDGQACEWTKGQDSAWGWGSLLGGAVGLIVVMFWLYGKVTPMGLFAAAIAGFLASWGGVLTQGIATAVLPPRTPGFVLFVIPCFLTGAIGAAMGLRVWWSDVKERRATGQVVDADLS